MISGGFKYRWLVCRALATSSLLCKNFCQTLCWIESELGSSSNSSNSLFIIRLWVRRVDSSSTLINLFLPRLCFPFSFRSSFRLLSSLTMKPDTPLDSAVFQLDETRTRCELWIAAGESSEKLASGFLMPFLSHLQSAQQQFARGAELIELQPPPSPVVQGAPWFTKRTIERFVRFVSTPDVLERVNFLDAERMKLAEASDILISKSPQTLSASEAANAETSSSSKHEETSFPTQTGMHLMDSLEIEAESSRKHLVNAMDARRLTLEKEQRKAFARAAAAGFSIDSLRELIAFAECFGATRLREACLQFGSLHSRLQELDMEEVQAELKQAEVIAEGKAVRNYGRRRVWGPPVSEIPLQTVKCVPECDGKMRWKDDDCALIGHDGESPQNSVASSRESDWEDTENSSSSKHPIYDNVIGQLMNFLPGREASKDEDDPPPQPAAAQQSSSETPAARRKGIVVIRNLKFPQAQAERITPKQSESTDSAEESECETKGGGRLSVRAAISLFETKQKQSSDVTTKPSKQSPDVKGAEKIQHKSSSRNSAKTMMVSEQKKKENSMQKLKSDSNEKLDMRTQPGVNAEKEAAARESSSQSTPRSADEISKELLDKSFTCLLKINSVVQDALLSASALQQGTQQVPEQSETEWRSPTTVSALDDMFIDSREPTTGTTRRQSLCTYECKTPPQKAAVQVQKNSATTGPKGASSDAQKGRLYDQYQEIREAKYKRESTITKAEREAKLKAMQDVLERRKTELLGRSRRLPEKNNTLSAEQIKALKFQSSKNNVLTSSRKEVRSDNVKAEKLVLRRASIPARTAAATTTTQKQESPTSKSTTPSTRKNSPGPPPPKAIPGIPKSSSGRLNSSPRSKLSNASPVSQRRMPNFMSQSVISESLHPQADVRKENARPLRRNSNLSSYQDTALPSLKNAQPRDTTRSLILPLETNKVGGSSDPDRELRGTGRIGGARVSENQILAPLKIARDIAAEQNNNSVKREASKIPKAVVVPSRTSRSAQSQQASSSVEVKLQAVPELKCEVAEASSTPVFVPKSNDECIKQIVSCNNTKNRQQEGEPCDSNELKPTLSDEPSIDVKSDESFREQPEAAKYLINPEEELRIFESQDLDEDMEIDDAVEKCMSGRSFLEGISASPLINNFGASVKNDSTCQSFKPEFSCSLRTGPSSQSLPHLPRSVSPSTMSSFRTDVNVPASQTKESKTLCKERHQVKDQPKGLKRLLKFGRKHRSSDSHIPEWSTINEDPDEIKTSRKTVAEEGFSSRSSGVRRSLEALPKIADAASELSRNFFSSFRSKSSACESRSRA